MTTLTTPSEKKRFQYNSNFNWNYFLQDNLTGSWVRTVGVVILTLLTVIAFALTVSSNPTLAWIVTIAWTVCVLSVVIGELFNVNFFINEWLKKNLITSISNALLTLFLALTVGTVVASILGWGIFGATWNTDLTGPDDHNQTGGATWGVIWGARKLLLTGRLAPEYNWRVTLNAALVGVLWLMTFITGRPNLKERTGTLRTITNIGWVLSPFISYIFLVGIDSSGGFLDVGKLIQGIVVVAILLAVLWQFKVINLTPVKTAMWLAAWPIAYVVWRAIGSLDIFTPINVDDLGGLLLTVIFAIFVNLLSFPLGILLALGRRAEVQGIPAWIIWPVAIATTAYFLNSSTPELWETSRNGFEQVLALWPLLILVAAFGLQYVFNGNMVQAASTVTIELVRGVPLITLLFMSIVMAPFFLAEGTQVRNFSAVIVGYTIFTASYTAELVRGGLQAIPRGQYEAADSLGFNALQKYRFIVLPQALRILIPALAGAVIGTFKSSSLVSLIGMFDFVGIARTVFTNDNWLGLKTELYVFMFVLYFVVSAVISWYSRRIEERTGLGVH